RDVAGGNHCGRCHPLFRRTAGARRQAVDAASQDRITTVAEGFDMYLARTARNFPFGRVAAGSVATIGAYDGLHLGHKKLLETVLDEAGEQGLPSVVMSFEPTPREFFSAASPPARLMRFREKFEALARSGVNIFYCPRFDERMRNMAADTFIRQLLIHAMNVRHLVIGDDFCFG